MRKIHVLSDERPSKRSMPFRTRDPGLLHDVLGDRPARDVHQRHAQEGGLVHADELLERLLVPVAQPLDEPNLLEAKGVLHADRL